MGRPVLLVVILALTSGCRTGSGYPALEGPRYIGPPPVRTARSNEDTIRVVTFNIQFSLRVDSAIAVLTGDSILRDADIVLLQEMDEPSTRRIAEVMGMTYAYYPATYHFKYQRDVGNAVLSRWPILEDRKIVLPHAGIFTATHRTATGATVKIDTMLVRVYSTHLHTVVNASQESRRNQMRAILADAEPYPRVIIGGDMNHPTVGRVAADAGYAWPTERGPRTAAVGRIDHIFFKGLKPDSAATGTVLNQRNASDHRPVWAKAVTR